jgi:YVTN family beta-propeller protein
MRGLVLVVLVTLFVGCGGGGDDDDAAIATPAQTALPAATATAMTAASAVGDPTASLTATQAATSTERPAPTPTVMDAAPTPIVVGTPAADLPPAGEIAAAIPVGVSPLVVAAGHGAIWVYNDMDGTLSRIDPATNAVVATIPVATPLTSVPPELLGERQASPDLAIDASSVWVNKPEEQAVVEVDPQTNTVIATIALEADPFSIAVDGSSLWVSLFSTSSVVRIDTATGEVVATIPGVPSPAGIAVAQDAVWVTNYWSDQVTRIDPQTNQVVGQIRISWQGAPVTGHPCSLCVGEVLANEHGVWVTLRFANHIARIDPATNRLAAIIPVGIQPRSLASDARGVWVGQQSSTGVLLIDPETNQVVAAVPATNAPNQLAWIALAENTLWAARAPTNDVVRIELLPD